jgi:hypothetical protein
MLLNKTLSAGVGVLAPNGQALLADRWGDRRKPTATGAVSPLPAQCSSRFAVSNHCDPVPSHA